jgi:cyclopropane fatty-acyl-phospholipid synthase-like methyltransferase
LAAGARVVDVGCGTGRVPLLIAQAFPASSVVGLDLSEPSIEVARKEAAQVAAAAGVRMLALTHLSSRYFGKDTAREAREVFPDTVVPHDFDIIELPFAERGVPQLLKGGALHDQSRPESVSSSPQ